MNTPSDSPNTPQTQNRDASSQRESRLRSVLKALSWRILATTTTGLIAYCLLLENSSSAAQTALKIAAVEFVLKFVIYYFHERAWQLVPRGAIRSIYRRSS